MQAVVFTRMMERLPRFSWSKNAPPLQRRTKPVRGGGTVGKAEEARVALLVALDDGVAAPDVALRLLDFCHSRAVVSKHRAACGRSGDGGELDDLNALLRVRRASGGRKTVREKEAGSEREQREHQAGGTKSLGRSGSGSVSAGTEQK